MKSEQSFFKIVSHWMFNKLPTEDFKQMRQSIRNSTDSELRIMFRLLWDDPRTLGTMPPDAKQKVLRQIEQRTNKQVPRNWLKVASIILVPLLIGLGGGYLLRPEMPYEQTELTVVAAAGQKSQVILPDGSVVWLNSESTLSYPADFGKQNRVVRLKGEGCFEVVKDENRKFVVETDQLNVMVHGTKFNVSSHPFDEVVTVTLLKGSVSVEDLSNKHLAMLVPDQYLYYDKKSHNCKVEKGEAVLATLWTENKCRFENASADEVFKKMAYWYGLNIHIENINKQYKYGLTIKNESVREMLELINELTPLEYTVNGEEVTVRYK